MSAEARMLTLIDDAVRAAVEPLERAVDELSARLAAVEGSGGAPDAEAPKRAARGRGGRAKAQPAEVSAITGDGVKTETHDDGLAGPEEKVPPQRKAAGE